jgi:hypothetical protein
MSDEPADLGPVDYLVVEFPAGATNFPPELAAEVASLAENGIVRVLDMLVLVKDEQGRLHAHEVADLDVVQELEGLERRLATVLAADDAEDVSVAMEPGTTAGVLVWEHLWAAPLGAAARRVGGQVVAGGRIAPDAVREALAASPSP